MIALLVILGFLAFCIVLAVCIDRDSNKNLPEPKSPVKWTIFYEKLKVLNGTKVEGRVFWIHGCGFVSWGNKCYDVGNFDLYGNKFFIELGREVEDDWYDPDGDRHMGWKLIGSFVIYGELPEK